jgi:putative methyltransferase (TIGR04325 family)
MKIIKEFIPPIAIKLIKTYLINPELNSSPKVYDSWQQALADSTPDDYQDPELVEVILEKTKNFIQSPSQPAISPTVAITLSALAVVLSELQPNCRKIHVIDWGGACGIHYFQCRRVLHPNISLKWCVVETPAMVTQARFLTSDELYFVEDLSEAIKSLETIDLFHTSGTLQCVSNPAEVLAEIVNSQAQFMLFNRLGLNRGLQDVITVHQSTLSGNGFGELPPNFKDRQIRYPFIFMAEHKFMNILREGYQVLGSFADSSGMFKLKGYDIIGGAYLLKQKTTELVPTSKMPAR